MNGENTFKNQISGYGRQQLTQKDGLAINNSKIFKSQTKKTETKFRSKLLHEITI